MENKSKQLEERTIQFSVDVITKLSKYSKQTELRPLIDQIIRSSTSIGANYHEANNASSRADFRNKIYISKKEAAETEYWLKVLRRLLPEDDLSLLENEVHELMLIFQKIVTTMRDINGK